MWNITIQYAVITHTLGDFCAKISMQNKYHLPNMSTPSLIMPIIYAIILWNVRLTFPVDRQTKKKWNQIKFKLHIPIIEKYNWNSKNLGKDPTTLCLYGASWISYRSIEMSENRKSSHIPLPMGIFSKSDRMMSEEALTFIQAVPKRWLHLTIWWSAIPFILRVSLWFIMIFWLIKK